MAIGWILQSDSGYYANKQPHYKYSFTDNINLTKIYKNEKSCWDFFFCFYCHTENPRLIEVDIDVVTETNSPNTTSSHTTIKILNEVPLNFNSQGTLIYPKHLADKIKKKMKKNSNNTDDCFGDYF